MPRSKLDIHSHQQVVMKHLLKPSTRGLIVYHAVGSGKTITALLTAKAMYQKLLIPTIVVCPSSVVPGFTKELARVVTPTSSYVQIFTPVTFARTLEMTPSFTTGKMVIIDEAHNFRSKDGALTNMLITACHQASKIMLLTGTPVHNEPMDIVPLLYMLQPPDEHIEYTSFESIFADALRKYEVSKRKSDLLKLLKGKVSLYLKTKSTSALYPSVTREKIELVMDKDYLQEYKQVENNDKTGLPRYMKGKNITVFFNGLRRASNTIRTPSEKVKKVLDLIHAHAGQKCVVYSGWKDAGITLVGRELTKAKISHVFVSGDQSQLDKKHSIETYNENKTDVMLISKAGAEGIDLKGTKVVIILEPHWNNELIRQVIGRAARLNSHQHLPVDERMVKVYDVILKKPHSYIGDLLEQIGLYKTDDVPSIDELIQTYADRKDDRIERFYRVMKASSIEHMMK